MTEQEIVSTLVNLNMNYSRERPWVTLTGGDPCIWDLSVLCVNLFLGGFKRIAVETQGALFQDWLENCELVTCSPKGPSSGMIGKFDITVLQKYHARLGERLVFKIVVFNKEDFDFAERIHKAFPQTRLYLTSGTNTSEVAGDALEGVAKDVLKGYRWAVDEFLKREVLHRATLSPQMHTLTWGRALGR